MDGVEKVSSLPLQQLEKFEIKAPFMKLSLFLWNIFMMLFCVLAVSFAASKMAHGDYSVGLLFFFASGFLIPATVKFFSSAFGGDLYIYQNCILQKGALGQKTVNFSKAFIKINSPKFAGGRVLYFTESEQSKLFARLKTILFLSDVMIIHLWMLTDAELQKLIKLLSNLSGQPESTFQPIQYSFQPFYKDQNESEVSN